MAKQKTPKTKTVKAVVGVAPKELPAVRKWNLWFAVVLAVQAIAIIILGNTMSVAVTRQYPAVDALATDVAGKANVLATASRHLFDVRLAYLVAAILLLLAAVYVVQATVYRKQYEAGLKQGQNPSRWLGFGVVGGAALMTIGLLSGLNQIVPMAAIFVFTVLACGLVAVLELVGKNQKGFLPHVLCISATVSAVMPLLFIASAVAGALMYGGHITSAMWGVYASALVSFGAFFLLTHFRLYGSGKWANALQTERAYMLLGFVTVSALAWQLFVGMLYP